MNYNPIPDLIIFGGFFLALGLMIHYTQPKRGATPGNVQRHQRKRRAYMLKRGPYQLREHRI